MTTRREIVRAETCRNVSDVRLGLADSDPSVRALSLGALDRLGELSPNDLHSALGDPDRDVVVRAIELSVPRPEIALIDGLSHSDDLVVETTAWALGERQNSDAPTISALVAVAGEHEVSICRESAIAALGAIGHPDGVPAILGGLTDRAPVRRRAVLALAPFDSPEVKNALTAALEDRDRQVRQAAEDLL